MPKARSYPAYLIYVAGLLGLVLVLPAVAGRGDDEQSTPSGNDTLIDGGPVAFRTRLAGLRGTPVVVNQWASWCGPCRFEFPCFGSQAERLKAKVAFLGVDSRDARGDARRFLAEHPVPFESFFDPDASIARVFRGGRSGPTTAFYTAGGKLAFTHQGAYPEEADLAADIARYATDD